MTPFNLRARIVAALATFFDPDPDLTPAEVIRLVRRPQRPEGVVTLLMFADGADREGNRTIVGIHQQLPDSWSPDRLADQLEAPAAQVRAGSRADSPGDLRRKG